MIFILKFEELSVIFESLVVLRLDKFIRAICALEKKKYCK
jgi:hypothetical protein